MIYLIKMIYPENVLYLWVILAWLIPLLKFALKYEWARHIFFFTIESIYMILRFNFVLFIAMNKLKILSFDFQIFTTSLTTFENNVFCFTKAERPHFYKHLIIYNSELYRQGVHEENIRTNCTLILWNFLASFNRTSSSLLNRTSSFLWIWFPISRSHENQQGKNT